MHYHKSFQFVKVFMNFEKPLVKLSALALLRALVRRQQQQLTHLQHFFVFLSRMQHHRVGAGVTLDNVLGLMHKICTYELSGKVSS